MAGMAQAHRETKCAGLPNGGMVCAEETRLVENYFAAPSATFTALTLLRLETGSRFRNALASSEAARAECVKARRALRDHALRHGCQPYGMEFGGEFTNQTVVSPASLSPSPPRDRSKCSRSPLDCDLGDTDDSKMDATCERRKAVAAIRETVVRPAVFGRRVRLPQCPSRDVASA